MQWNSKKAANYALWKSRVAYHDLRRRAGVAYARVAPWMAVRNPDFIGIGAARTGSTWLYDRLSLHPDVCLPKRKEIHFFSDLNRQTHGYVYGPSTDKTEWTPLDIENPYHWRWYLGHFGKCGGKVTGEFTPDYALLSKDRIAIVKRNLPDVKLIYAMRNPVSRAWSSVRKELWRRFQMHPRDVEDTQLLVELATQPGVLRRGDYRTAIENWETHYAGQILYQFYDDLAEDQAGVLATVCEFLALDPEPLTRVGGHDRRVNDVPTDEIPAAVREALERYYEPQLDFLSAKFGRDLSHWFSLTRPAATGTRRPHLLLVR